MPYTYAVSAAGRPAGLARLGGAPRGLVRSARALAGRTGTGPGRVGSRTVVHTLLVTIAMLLPGVSQAQAQEVVLVSNMANPSGGSFFITPAEHLKELFGITVAEGEKRIAQQFRTGANTKGYTLGSVVLNLEQEGAPAVKFT